MWAELLVFGLIVLAGQFSPGPDMMLLTRTALAEGAKAGTLMVFGIVCGLAVHATVAIGGMASLMASGGVLSQVVSILAAGYLVWLAVGILRGGETNSNGVDGLKRGAFSRGLMFNLLNPKVVVFFGGVVVFGGGSRSVVAFRVMVRDCWEWIGVLVALGDGSAGPSG